MPAPRISRRATTRRGTPRLDAACVAADPPFSFGSSRPLRAATLLKKGAAPLLSTQNFHRGRRDKLLELGHHLVDGGGVAVLAGVLFEVMRLKTAGHAGFQALRRAPAGKTRARFAGSGGSARRVSSGAATRRQDG